MEFSHGSIQKKVTAISELRHDLVSGDWVVIATGRGMRPHEFLQKKQELFRQPKTTCPFEKLGDNALLTLPSPGKKRDWWVKVIINKYPAFTIDFKHQCAVVYKEGIYEWTAGVGFHEVVVTRDHARAIPDMTEEEVALLVQAYQDRYMAFKDDPCVQYVSIFHNHGHLAGATIAHPHSQIIATPVIPPDVHRSLKGVLDYYTAHRACVHCLMLNFERKEGVRVIHENSHFIALAPYASRSAFEMRIFPKAHEAQFELMSAADRMAFADALRISLAKLSHGLQNPDFNFFLHTAPLKDTEKYQHYHWHFEIVPKTAIWAGFEIGTGIEISTIAPESAAEFLRTITV